MDFDVVADGMHPGTRDGGDGEVPRTQYHGCEMQCWCICVELYGKALPGEAIMFLQCCGLLQAHITFMITSILWLCVKFLLLKQACAKSTHKIFYFIVAFYMMAFYLSPSSLIKAIFS